MKSTTLALLLELHAKFDLGQLQKTTLELTGKLGLSCQLAFELILLNRQ